MAVVTLKYESENNADGTKTVTCYLPTATGQRYFVTVPGAATRADVVTAMNAVLATRKVKGLDYPGAPATNGLTIDVTV